MFNRQIIVDKFPLPSADELIVKLAGAKVFSKLDIRSAYFHMPLTEDSRSLTAFFTPNGLYQYKVLPMGLSSAPSAWQRCLSQTLSDLPGCIVYMDDLCVFGCSQEDHDANLHALLKRLDDLNLRLNLKKCQFRVTKIVFLEYVISTAGVSPNEENIRSILECPKPKSSIEIKHFLGLCSYYLRHLPNFSTVAEPLRRLTRENEEFVWNTEQEHSYQSIRTMISSAPTVAIFDESCHTCVSTDASDVGLGAILSQMQDGCEKVIAYASRTLSKTERNYSTGEKEALACMWACEKWHLYLFGRKFTLRTDHSSLTTLLCRGNKGQRPLRISRWYARLLNYDFEVQYVRGSQYRIPDALSRLPLENEGENEDLSEIRMIASLENYPLVAITKASIQKETENDSVLLQLREILRNGWRNRKEISPEIFPYFAVKDELSVVDDCVMRGEHFVVPATLIQNVINCGHEGHPGIVRTKSRIREYFWWPRLNSSVECAIRQCGPCQNADKSAKPLKAPVIPIEYPMRPWAKIAIDIMGPFQSALPNKRNVLVATCFYSKWPEASVCGEVTTKTVITWLKQLFARYGLPEEILTDNGPQFRSYEFTEYLKLNDIRHATTVPYNPAANGMVERLNRTLKESIQAICLQGERWEDAPLTALMTYRTTPHTVTGETP